MPFDDVVSIAYGVVTIPVEARHPERQVAAQDGDNVPGGERRPVVRPGRGSIVGSPPGADPRGDPPGSEPGLPCPDRLATVAYDEALAARIRSLIGDHPGLSEREMFGGIAFMIDGNMAVGVSGDELMVRVGKEAHEEAVDRPGARTFDMGARPMKGWVNVSGEGFTREEDLESWVAQGVGYASILPSK